MEVLKRNSVRDLLRNFMSARLGHEAGFALGARAGIDSNGVGSYHLWLSQKPGTRMNTPAFAVEILHFVADLTLPYGRVLDDYQT